LKLSEPAREICCSFCHKGKAVVGTVISAPDSTAFICDECVAACQSIIEDVKDGTWDRQGLQRQRTLFYNCFGFTVEEIVEYVTAE
jgi:hypothetical protein